MNASNKLRIGFIPLADAAALLVAVDKGTALDAGLDPATPALAVTDATRPGEASMAATVAELPARLDALQPRGATLVMIGRTMAPEGRGEARAPAQPTGMTLTATEMRCPPEASTTPSIGATSA